MENILVHGGWMLLPIVCCLLTAVFLIFNGIARTSRDRIGPLGHEQTLRALFRQRDFAAAETFSRENRSSLTKVLRVGLTLLAEGPQAILEGMRTELEAERLRLHKRFSYLHALALCTPLLGLIGTLTGAATALFRNAEDPPALLRALGASLIPSAAGLLVGIVASSAFYVLRERASSAMLRLQDIVHGIFRALPSDALAPPAK